MYHLGGLFCSVKNVSFEYEFLRTTCRHNKINIFTRQIFLVLIPTQTEVNTSSFLVLNADPITSMSVANSWTMRCPPRLKSSKLRAAAAYWSTYWMNLDISFSTILLSLYSKRLIASLKGRKLIGRHSVRFSIFKPFSRHLSGQFRQQDITRPTQETYRDERNVFVQHMVQE